MRWWTAGCWIWMMAASVAHVEAQVVVAHRGASYDAPENTLAAFRLAFAQGADGIEADFHLTQDQRIVCIHDADTARTGGKKLVVADSTLAELRQLEYGGWKHPRFHGEVLPTFAEVLLSVPEDRLFVIELKTGPEIVPLLVAELQRLQANPANLLIISFQSATVRESKRLLPQVRAHWLTSYKQDTQTGRWAPTMAQIAATLEESQADGLGSQAQRAVLDASFLVELKGRGMREFHVWTVDDPTDARYFRGLGAIGITTNRPGLIKAALVP